MNESTIVLLLLGSLLMILIPLLVIGILFIINVEIGFGLAWILGTLLILGSLSLLLGLLLLIVYIFIRLFSKRNDELK